MAVPEIHLVRGATGLEAQTPDGALIGHICHSDEVGLILDKLLEEFPVQAWRWVYLKAQEKAPDSTAEVPGEVGPHARYGMPSWPAEEAHDGR